MKKLMTLIALVAGFVFATSAFAADKKIERLWKSKCSSCHGQDGKAQTEKGKKMNTRDMTTAEYQKATDEDFEKAIKDGVKKEKDGEKQEMDGYADLKPEEIKGLVGMIRELGPKK